MNETHDTVALLASPETYGEGAVDVLETHFSWLFFVGAAVYKLKKPVRLPYLDFSTPERRHANAAAEVRLNRRLTTGVYHGVVPVTAAPNGRPALAGAGRPIDWLVHMRRLDASRCLCELLASGAKPRLDALAGGLARRLARFHATVEVASCSPAGYVDKLTRQVRELASELARPELSLPEETARTVSSLGSFLQSETALFERRVTAARVVEGHGDLRPEHVFFEEEPQIIDCLEFSRTLREVDAADELAYLELECEGVARADVGEQIVEAYFDFAGERPSRRLLDFYATLRACVRATLALRREPDPEGRGRFRRRALSYLALAARRVGRL